MAITTDNQRRNNPETGMPGQIGTARPDIHVNQTTTPSRASTSPAGFIAVVIIVLAGLAFAMYVYSNQGTMMPDVIQNNTTQTTPEVLPVVPAPDATIQQTQPDATVPQQSGDAQPETTAPAPSANP